MGYFSGIEDAIFGKPSQGGTVTPSQSFQQSLGMSGNVQNIYGPQAQALEPFFGFTGDLLNRFQGSPEQLVAGFNPTDSRPF